MEVVTIETPELGDRSYLFHDRSTALAVDPQRDIDRTLAAAEAAGVRISHVVETHVHNDYVTGGAALAREVGAEYGVSAADEVRVPRRALRAGDVLTPGTLRVEVLETPGHTPGHLAYFVSDPQGRHAVATGGSLLYGSVGRTDLISAEATDGLTRAQYRSARRLAEHLPGDTLVLPTHGFGSFCSSTPTSGVASSTLADERLANPALCTEDEEEFVRALLSGLTDYPRYYAHMAAINRAGPEAFRATDPELVDPEVLRKRISAGEWVVDLRPRAAFAAAHLPGTVSCEHSPLFTTYLGWVLPWGVPLTLVGESLAQVRTAQRDLARIGIDPLAGASVGSPPELAASEKLTGYPRVGFAELAAQRDRVVVLDSRRPDEWAAGHIAGAVHIPLPDIPERLAEIPAGPVWVHCGVGFRASIAASLLERAGRDVVLIDDDFARAREVGLPLVS